ncbi:hypothetical protein ERX46_14805 [Brumimicrobium glaciale]|uniref:TonB C-terminal domain-containing protein n=1 Tax=Brumimicrobium glaciale TaxID=200475 RepID=A0A4Q4KL38_9FLAO|nr:hypothetical protein [Brumimicrobium glaciale]RYM32539.1 hypothetical protein ERX46_14805 [Brumimicrobium glaciale]
MKKLNAILFLMLFLTSTAYSQLSGDIIKDNRKLTTDLPYVIEGHITGKITIQISVDALGEISSSKVLDGESTIKSTPAKIKALNHVSQFKFEPGTWFPKFHQGIVVITMVRAN